MLLLSSYTICLSPRFTWRLPLVEEDPPRTLFSINVLSLSSGIESNSTQVFFEPALLAKHGVL